MTTTTTDTALTVRGLDVYYGESQILRDIDMDIPKRGDCGGYGSQWRWEDDAY